MKLIPTMMFISAEGYDKNHNKISYHSSNFEPSAKMDIVEFITNIMTKSNSKVVYVNIISLTPLEFKSIK